MLGLMGYIIGFNVIASIGPGPLGIPFILALTAAYGVAARFVFVPRLRSMDIDRPESEDVVETGVGVGAAFGFLALAVDALF